MMNTNNEIMPKIRRSVTLSEETMAWINEEIKRKRFKDVSHALDYAIYRLMEEQKKEG
jgi:Arc/MetJ-type ribon-helix-helix transcriptional regulator